MLKPVCYAILGKSGMWMSESCICEDADVLQAELEYAREEKPSEDYKIVPLYTRLDAAEKRIEELELATPCPLLKSICEGWEFTVKLDKEEIIERYAGEIHTIRALDSVQLDTVKQLLSDLIDEVTR